MTLREQKNEALREYVKLLRWTELVEGNEVNSERLKELLLSPVNAREEKNRKLLEKLMWRAYADGEFRPKTAAILFGIVGGEPLRECVEGALAFVLSQEGKPVPEEWRVAVENVRKGKVQGRKEKSVVVGLEYLKLLERMDLKGEEWERIELKMKTVGVPAFRKYYDGSFAEALDYFLHRHYRTEQSSEEGLRLTFHPKEVEGIREVLRAHGYKVADLNLSEEDEAKLKELTEKVLRAVGVEGNVVVVPLKGAPGCAAWKGGVGIIGVDVELMERAKKGDTLLYVTLLAHEGVHLRNGHLKARDEGKLSFVKTLSGERTDLGAVRVYGSTVEYLADKGAVEVAVRLSGKQRSEVVKAFGEYLKSFKANEELNDLLYAHRQEFLQP